MSLYRVGLIGWPVTHSLSPAMHNAAFAALGLADWRYDLLPVPPDIVGHSLRTLRGEGGYLGVNVTVPLKEKVLAHTQPDDLARAVGAANTIDFRTNVSTNTDVAGLISDLEANRIALLGTRALVLGAGGAARAAVFGLVRAGASVVVANRTMARAQAMLANLALAANVRGVEALPLEEAAAAQPGLIVNCTPVGMWPQVDSCPWPDDIPFPEGAVVYDMVYRPARTRLMALAEAHGGRAIGGLGMLVRQGAAAFTLWTGQAAPFDVMLAAAQAALAADSGP
ncbi:MAG: shikimate dehydrogenase [Aggregatilineales bacterium]